MFDRSCGLGDLYETMNDGAAEVALVCKWDDISVAFRVHNIHTNGMIFLVSHPSYVPEVLRD